MKKHAIIYAYTDDLAAAEEKAAELRDLKWGAMVRDINMFDQSQTEPCDLVVLFGDSQTVTSAYKKLNIKIEGGEAAKPGLKGMSKEDLRFDAANIPTDWEQLSWPKMRALSLQLGGPQNSTREEVEGVIRGELERRVAKTQTEPKAQSSSDQLPNHPPPAQGAGPMPVIPPPVKPAIHTPHDDSDIETDPQSKVF